MQHFSYVLFIGSTYYFYLLFITNIKFTTLQLYNFFTCIVKDIRKEFNGFEFGRSYVNFVQYECSSTVSVKLLGTEVAFSVNQTLKNRILTSKVSF